MTPVDGALPVNIRNFAGTITCWLLRATGDSPGSFYSSTIPVWLYPLARCCGLCPQHGVIGEGNHEFSNWSVASAKLNGVILNLHAYCLGSQQESEPFGQGARTL